jgi:hypothetical protein
MKRLLSILLALILGLAPSLMALPAGALTLIAGNRDEANLPACCRRNGAHHCHMNAEQMRRMMAASSGETTLGAPSCCPSYPRSVATSVSSEHALVASVGGQSTLLVERRTPQSSRAAALISARRTWPKRGPPSLL